MTTQTPQAPACLDPQTYELVLNLQQALQTGASATADALALLGCELCERLLEHYTPARNAAERLALAPWQERRAKELLERSLDDRLPISDVARQCALSRSHFSRAFKRATGLSPQEWLLERRIARAKVLLLEGELSLAQIGLDCGFADQSHFIRMFARWVGVAPRRWQRLNHTQGEVA